MTQRFYSKAICWLLTSFIVLMTQTYTQSPIHAASPEISAEELKQLIDKKEVFILDVNSKKSFDSGHIPGAYHFAEHEKNLSAILPKDKNALVVAYCGSTRCTAWEAAYKAADKLGYKNVKHLKIGIKGWKEAKLPTESK